MSAGSTDRSLSGKVAVVTGGTRGIGRAIAEKLASQGAKVTITGRGDSLSKDINSSVFGFLAVDFLEDSQVAAAVAQIEKLEPDILVNNAGITAVGGIAELDLCAYSRVEKVNIRAPFILSRAVIPTMTKRKWGRIINISSIFGVIGRDNRSPYCVTKFGLNGMTVALSAEVAQFGVLVNSVCPGFINTELTASVLSEVELNDLISKVPARRLGTPIEVAELVGWLSGPSNTFVSGQSIVIDGGYTCV